MSDELTPLRRAQHMRDKLQEIHKGLSNLVDDPDVQQLNREAQSYLTNAATLVAQAQTELHNATMLLPPTRPG